MTTFGEDLVRSLGEALAHAKGEGPPSCIPRSRGTRSGNPSNSPKPKWHLWLA